MADYNPKEIEKKWQQQWEAEGIYKVENDPSKPKYYVLDMFPYPSGAGLHVGHPLGYIASDIVSRYKRSRGFSVLHPMGFDSFGLPAEQYAIQTGQHPAVTTANNIETYKRQLKKIGFSYDWDREVRTSDPLYYKWTQWIFMQLFNGWYNRETDKAEPIAALVQKFEHSGNRNVHAVCDEDTFAFTNEDWKAYTEKEKADILLKYRLTYLAESVVNWCPALGTVLANDEVKDGVSERGGYPVERKKMKQWSMRITAYADRLLRGLDTIDWPEPLKEMQRNWIGRSEGASVRFGVNLTPGPSPEERGEGNLRSGYPSEEARSGSEVNPAYTSSHEQWQHAKPKARELRKEQTEAEAILWNELRNQKLGTKFRRQHAINAYIVDFVAIDEQLVVEVDGGIHREAEQAAYDTRRTQLLEESGFGVIRFTNEEVARNTPAVVQKIKAVLEKRRKPSVQANAPSAPLSSGEGLGVRSSGDEALEVFTTRPDTIFGVTFLVIAPEHERLMPLAQEALSRNPELQETYDNLVSYVETARNRSERERMAEVKTITGAFTGFYVEHPFTGEDIPVWTADYVLAGYGTGAVMAVPSSDTRDYAFAKHFNLSIVPVQEGDRTDISAPDFDPKAGTMINSGFLNGLPVKEAVPAAIRRIEEMGIGKGKINYRMRDAVFSRQRYWGEPVPVYFKDDIPHLLPESELPLVLPEIDQYKPTQTGEPPLGRAKDWKYCPPTPEVGVDLTPGPSPEERGGKGSPFGGGGAYPYELSTMPGWAGSSWYFFRYMDPHNDTEFCSKEARQYWQDVDLYIGGSEHATGHLLYSRFWTKFLYDFGHVTVDEPFRKLVNQGMISSYSYFVDFYKGFDHDTYTHPIGHGQEYTVCASSDYFSAHLNSHHLEFRGKEIVGSQKRRRIPIEYTDTGKLYKSSFEEFVHTPLFKSYDIEIDINSGVLWKTDEKGEYIDLYSEVEKMSKSKYNVVNPDDVVTRFGADTLRMYEMFLGPLTDSKPWNTNGITGVHNFLRRYWRLFHTEKGDFTVSDAEPAREELKSLHKLIKKVAEDIDNLSLNTSVSAFMVCVNELSSPKCNKRAVLSDLTVVLSSFAPHITEEIWHLLGNTGSVTREPYPAYNQSYLVEDSFEYPVSINGKVRAKMTFPADTAPAEIEQAVLAAEAVQKWLEGKQPKKVIVVPKRIVNVVL